MSFDVQKLVNLKRLNTIAVSKDATFAIAELSELDAGGSKYISHLWHVDLASGEKNQLTFGEWSNRSPKLNENDELFFLSNRPTQLEDKNHKKRFQVYKNQIGDALQLSDEPLGVMDFQIDAEDNFVVKSNYFPGIEREEQRVHADDLAEKGPTALFYTDSNVRYWDHWIGAAKANFVSYRKDKQVYQSHPLNLVDSDTYQNANWKLSKDGSFLITSFVYTSNKPRAERVDRLDDTGFKKIEISSGKESILFKGDGRWAYGFALSKDDSTLLYIDFERLPDRFGSYDLVSLDIESGESKKLDFSFDGEVRLQELSEDSKHLYFLADHQTTTSLFSFEIESGKIEQVTKRGTLHQCVLRGSSFIGVLSSLLSPPEIFKQEGYSKLEILTNLSEFEALKDVKVQSHTVKSTDGSDVQFFGVGKGNADRNMIAIHGGPVGQWGDVWHWRWNSLVFAELGYEVFLPNPRGSTGFGQDFVDGIFGDTWGKQCYEDLMCVADEIEKISPAENTVTMGGSFGGYMTNWIATQTDRFDALMTHAGLFDLHQFYGTTDGPAYWSRVFQQNVYEDRNAFDKYSPARFVKNWKTPTLVIHGEKDYRVPISEALYLFDALQYFEVDSEMLIFPDENHWILRPNNIVTWYETIARFFDERL